MVSYIAVTQRQWVGNMWNADCTTSAQAEWLEANGYEVASKQGGGGPAFLVILVTLHTMVSESHDIPQYLLCF